MRRLACLGLLALTLPAMAARLTITSYGVPHTYPLDPTDKLTFDESGLRLSVNSVSKSGAPSLRSFYLGYSNKVRIDTVGGALKTMFIATTDSGTVSKDVDLIDFVEFTPVVDSTGDTDKDGLTNYQELMLYHTDPKKSDTDGDGISDGVEVGWDPVTYSPLVANLPEIRVSLDASPRILLKETVSKSSSEQLTASTSNSWGKEDGSSTSRSVMNSEQIAAGFTFGMSTTYEASAATPGLKWGFNWEARLDVTQTHEVTNEWSNDQRVSFNKTLEESKTRASELGTSISGATIEIPITISNPGTIGYTLTGAEYTLYGTSYYNGQPTETALLSITSQSGMTSLEIGRSYTGIVLTKEIDLAKVELLKNIVAFTVRRTGGSIGYTIQNAQGQGAISLLASDVSTSVNGSTARVEVDFDNAKIKQESIVRQVATLNKPDLTGTKYMPTYLGELLQNMGLAYSFDDTGFIEVNGLGRNSTNSWVAIRVTNNAGGKASDTLGINFKGKAGPDSVIVNAGDYILLGYSGDDDKDGVPNLTEKFYKINDLTSSDYDRDGVSDSLEIYGRWINKGTKDTAFVFTSPRLADSDRDGLNDKLDQFPLNPRLRADAHIKSFVLYGLNNAKDSLVFDAATTSKAAVKSLAVRMKLAVAFDSVPRWCKAVLNRGVDTLVLVQDGNDASGLRFVLPDTSKQFLIGNNTIELIARSMDGSHTRTWTVTGTSAPVAAPDLIGTITRDETKPWKVNRISLSMVGQNLIDPRVKGFALYRREVTATIPPQIAKTNQLPAAYAVVKGMNFLGSIESGSTTISDSGLSGKQYQYLAVPYVRVGEDYNFVDSAQTSFKTAAALKKIVVKPQFHTWHCDNENDNTGDAEIVVGMRVWMRALNGTEVSLIDKSQKWEGVRDGRNENIDWSVMPTLMETDTVRAFAYLYEQDDGRDDYNWNSDVFKVRVKDLLESSTIAAMGITGYATNDANSTKWDKGTPGILPTAAAPNRLLYVAQKSSDAVVTIYYSLSWWLED